MAIFRKDDVELYYEEYGSGYPLLILAPGALRSRMRNWGWNPKYANGVPWIDPRVELSPWFRVIAMDQRNAGKSRAPIRPTDGYMTYFQDHIDLLDHLGIERAHVMGGCIGCSFVMSFAKHAPQRISAGVLQQPIGLDGNMEAYRENADGWKKEMMAKRPEVPAATFDAIFANMHATDFVFTVDRAFMRQCPIPVFVMPGDNQAHPATIGEELAALAPRSIIHRDWKGPANRTETIRLVAEFLQENTPADQRRAA